MVLCRYCTLLIWIGTLALLCSYQVQGAEVDDSLSYIDTFDYLDSPDGGEYEYEPLLDIPDTTKPTVTSPSEPTKPDNTGTPPRQPKPEPEPEPTPSPVVPGITIDQGNVTVPGVENITNTVISNLPNTTEVMAPQPMIPVAVEAVSPEPAMPSIPPATVIPESPPSPPPSPSLPPSSSSSPWMVPMSLIVGLLAMI